MTSLINKIFSLFLPSKKGGAKTVRYYDGDTGKEISIPSEELASGVVKTVEDGKNSPEAVWMNPSDLRQNSYVHEPFDGDVKAIIEDIQSALYEVYPRDYEFWEDGFRRDQNVEQELAIWLYVSRLFEEICQETFFELEKKQEVFNILAACMTSDRDNVRNIINVEHLNEEEVSNIIKKYYKE